MVRTRVRWWRAVSLGVAAAALLGLAGRAAASGGSPERSDGQAAARAYVVKPGDTLWAIALRIAGPTADPRPLVDAIATLNHSNGALVPGETLRIPTAS